MFLYWTTLRHFVSSKAKCLCAGDPLCPQPAQHVLRIAWATEGKHEPLLDYWSRCFTAGTVVPRPQCQCSEFSLPYCLSDNRSKILFVFCSFCVNSTHYETPSSLGATILCEFWPAQQFSSIFLYPEPSYSNSESSVFPQIRADITLPSEPRSP